MWVPSTRLAKRAVKDLFLRVLSPRVLYVASTTSLFISHRQHLRTIHFNAQRITSNSLFMYMKHRLRRKVFSSKPTHTRKKSQTKCRRKFISKFSSVLSSSISTIYWQLNTFRSGSVLEEKRKRKWRVSLEEIWDNTGVSSEAYSQKYLFLKYSFVTGFVKQCKAVKSKPYRLALQMRLINRARE